MKYIFSGVPFFSVYTIAYDAPELKDPQEGRKVFFGVTALFGAAIGLFAFSRSLGKIPFGYNLLCSHPAIFHPIYLASQAPTKDIDTGVSGSHQAIHAGTKCQPDSRHFQPKGSQSCWRGIGWPRIKRRLQIGPLKRFNKYVSLCYYENLVKQGESQQVFTLKV